MENFGFAFNDGDFSDRVLHIEIIPDHPLTPKKKKPPQRKKHGTTHAEAQVKSLHISSPILAAKSPFFYKLFKTEMIESKQRDVTLRIRSSEESALMDLLNFVYTNTLSATSCSDLLNVLMAADKFGVASCMTFCIQLLLKIPMTLESALLYLELPLTAVAVQPLINASKKYLVTHFCDFNHAKREEAMGLPLFALEVVLGGETLQVDSEDEVFDFVLDWAYQHYPKTKERQEILSKHLAQFIHFQYMSCSKLKEALDCTADFKNDHVSKLVMEALFSKVEVPYGQHMHSTTDRLTAKTSCLGRLYNNGLVKVVQLKFPWPSCVVYFDLHKASCRNQCPLKAVYSESFPLGGRWFHLRVQCDNEGGMSYYKYLGVFLHIEEGSESCTVDFECAAMKKLSREFESQRKIKDYVLREQQSTGWSNLFGISWTDLMSEKCEYFIDGILHLRAHLTIINSQPV